MIVNFLASTIAFLVCLSAVAGSPSSKPVIERFIERAAKDSGYAKDAVREFTVRTLIKSSQFSRLDLSRIEAGLSHNLSPRLQREMVSYLGRNMNYRKELRLRSLRDNALFSRFGEKFNDIIERSYLEGMKSHSITTRVKAVEAACNYIMGKEAPELRNAVHEAVLMDPSPRVRLAGLNAMRVHTNLEQRLVAELVLHDPIIKVRAQAERRLLSQLGSSDADVADIIIALQKIYWKGQKAAQEGRRELEAIKLRMPAG